MSAEAPPLIGVPCFSIEAAGSRRPLYANNQAYLRALIAAGAIPVMIPLGLSDAALEALCARLDGLLLSGGADIDPALYGQERLPECGSIESDRDGIELTLTRMALERDLPVLGICRGIQTLNVACGGDLYQDIATQLPEAQEHDGHHLPRDHRSHAVTVKPDSLLHAIVGVDELQVNSLHHQAARKVGDGLLVTAQAPDGVIEAIEARGRRFVLAVQYHPEELAETDALSRRLFEAFTQASRQR